MIFSRKFCKSQDHRFNKWTDIGGKLTRKCRICGYIDYDVK